MTAIYRMDINDIQQKFLVGVIVACFLSRSVLEQAVKRVYNISFTKMSKVATRWYIDSKLDSLSNLCDLKTQPVGIVSLLKSRILRLACAI